MEVSGSSMKSQKKRWLSFYPGEMYGDDDDSRDDREMAMLAQLAYM